MSDSEVDDNSKNLADPIEGSISNACIQTSVFFSANGPAGSTFFFSTGHFLTTKIFLSGHSSPGKTPILELRSDDTKIETNPLSSFFFVFCARSAPKFSFLLPFVCVPLWTSSISRSKKHNFYTGYDLDKFVVELWSCIVSFFARAARRNFVPLCASVWKTKCDFWVEWQNVFGILAKWIATSFALSTTAPQAKILENSAVLSGIL